MIRQTQFTEGLAGVDYDAPGEEDGTNACFLCGGGPAQARPALPRDDPVHGGDMGFAVEATTT